MKGYVRVLIFATIILFAFLFMLYQSAERPFYDADRWCDFHKPKLNLSDEKTRYCFNEPYWSDKHEKFLELYWGGWK